MSIHFYGRGIQSLKKESSCDLCANIYSVVIDVTQWRHVMTILDPSAFVIGRVWTKKVNSDEPDFAAWRANEKYTTNENIRLTTNKRIT